MHLSRRAAIGLIAATLVIASTAYAWTCYRDRAMSHPLFSSPMHTLCVGRYLIDVPAQYELESYDFRIDGVDIIWQYSIPNEEEFRKQLSARVAELEAAKNEYGRQSLEKVEDIHTPEFSGKLLYFGRREPLTWTELGKEVSSKEGLSAEIWLWLAGKAVTLKGKDLQIDKVGNVIRLAKPLRALAANEVPAEPGFCMEMLDARAMIVGLPGHDQTEKSEVQFGLKDHPDVKFDFTMYTNGDKLGEPLHVRHARTQIEMANLMHLFSQLRNGSRTIHGIEGDELVEAVRELNGTRGLSFGWEPLGRPNDPFAPYIVFDMKTGYSHDGPVQSSLSDDVVALQLWDAVVGSIRLRPTGPAKASSGEGSPTPKPKTPVGTNVRTGSVCPESGWWWGPDTDEGVDPRHFFRAGEVMPRANIEAPLSALDRLLGRRPRIDVSTVWKLVAYATDSELRQKPSRPARSRSE